MGGVSQNIGTGRYKMASAEGKLQLLGEALPSFTASRTNKLWLQENCVPHCKWKVLYASLEIQYRCETPPLTCTHLPTVSEKSGAFQIFVLNDKQVHFIKICSTSLQITISLFAFASNHQKVNTSSLPHSYPSSTHIARTACM